MDSEKQQQHKRETMTKMKTPWEDQRQTGPGGRHPPKLKIKQWK